MVRSSFDLDGLNLGDLGVNISRVYGLSDFWQLMFEDSSNIELMLESTAFQASDIYSKFLQLTSTMDLNDIQTTVGYQTKLILLSSADAITGETNTYKISDSIVDARFIANRPFLPTVNLEKDVHFSFVDNGANIRFYADISTLGFPVRQLSDGTHQYALWAVDAQVDDQLIYQYFANLIAVSPETSTDAFKSFVNGLFYLYVNGPNLAMMRKGLNLVLGIPLARGNETVLDIRQYLDTDQYLVTTDQNAYLIPYGIAPSVSTGDQVTLGQELAQWVEVKDYLSDGEWWVNLQIPSSVIPHIPDGQTDRKAKPGSYVDEAMRGYLKNHTFLVNVNVTTFKSVQYFEQLFSIIKRAKPSYATPIYIWSVPIPTETLQLNDDGLAYDRNSLLWAHGLVNILEFNRNSSTPFLRSSPIFTRYSISQATAEQAGQSTAINGNSRNFDGGTLTGFVNFQAQYRSNTDAESGWMRTLMTRGGDTRILRSNMSFTRGVSQATDGTGYRPYPGDSLRLVPIHATLWADIQNRMSSLNISLPSTPTFTLLKPNTNEGPNGTVESDFSSFMQANIATLFERGANYSSPYLGRFMPVESYRTFVPQSTDIQAGDYMFFAQIQDNTWGVYWATSNNTAGPMSFIFGDSEVLNLSVSSKPSRGFGNWGTPFYTVRGAGYTLAANGTSDADTINRTPINGITTSDTTLSVSYSDINNSAMPVTRGGMTLTMTKESS